MFSLIGAISLAIGLAFVIAGLSVPQMIEKDIVSEGAKVG